MTYTTNNELEHFAFDEAVVDNIRRSFGGDAVHVILDNVKILPENSCNRDIRTMRTNGLDLQLLDAKIENIVEEGYQLYDADFKPYKRVEDRDLPPEEIDDMLVKLRGWQLDNITQEGQLITVHLRGDDHTFRVEIEAKGGSTQSWERFMTLD